MMARRQALRLSVRQAAVRAAINRATWSALENGERSPRAYSRAGIEEALGWAPGSVDAILNGREPALPGSVADSGRPSPPADVNVVDDQWVRVELDRIKHLPVDVETKKALIRAVIDTAYEAAQVAHARQDHVQRAG